MTRFLNLNQMNSPHARETNENLAEDYWIVGSQVVLSRSIVIPVFLLLCTRVGKNGATR